MFAKRPSAAGTGLSWVVYAVLAAMFLYVGYLLGSNGVGGTAQVAEQGLRTTAQRGDISKHSSRQDAVMSCPACACECNCNIDAALKKVTTAVEALGSCKGGASHAAAAPCDCPEAPACPACPEPAPVKQTASASGGDVGPKGMFPRRRPRIVHNALWAGPHCQDKAAYVRQFNGQAVVVEVGAFTGEEIPMFRGLVKKLITYEPSPMKIDAIRNTVAGAGMSDVVTVRPAAASDRDGEATFTIAKTEGTQQDSLGNIDFMVSTGRNITVQVVKIDTELDERIHLLKIDTQGHEWSVIRGAERIIREHGIDIIHAEFSPALMRGHGVNPADFLEYLWQLGYTCMYCNDRFGLPDSELPATSGGRAREWGWNAFTQDFGELHEIPGHGAWGDLLCI